MGLFLRGLLVSFVLMLVIFTTNGICYASPIVHVSKANMIRVLRVHNCEEPRWDVIGPVYQGGLGWLHATWLQFRLPWYPLWMNQATILEQASAMVRFAYKYGWPDQNGVCHGY